MATQSITLDELLTMIKNTKIKYNHKYLWGQAYQNPNGVNSGTHQLSDSIENYDFVTLEAGDENLNNPDQSIITIIPKAITYGLRYSTYSYGITNEDGHETLVFAFTDATHIRVDRGVNHFLQRIIGWKSSLDIGGGVLDLVFRALSRLLLGGACYYGTN